jgi:hypothetical protein
MFCLDFALAFISHATLCRFIGVRLSEAPSEKTNPKGIKALGQAHCNDSNAGQRTRIILSEKPYYAFGLGAVAGSAAAVGLYPFDIVRAMSVAKNQSSFAFSTIPFMTVYLGLYFSRDRLAGESPSTKFSNALLASCAAALCELPFDHAKVNISGGSRWTAAAATALRVPLAAALLVAYDRILDKTTADDT